MLVSRFSNRQSWLIQFLLVLAVGFFLIFVLPSFMSDFRQNVMGKLVSFAIVAIGLDLLWGYGVMLSLGQGVFFGLGGYTTAILMAKSGVAFWLALPVQLGQTDDD